MKQQGVVPEVLTYSALISTCEKGAQSEQALGIFAELKRQGLAPGVITYNALISAWEKGKQPEQALKVFEAM